MRSEDEPPRRIARDDVYIRESATSALSRMIIQADDSRIGLLSNNNNRSLWILSIRASLRFGLFLPYTSQFFPSFDSGLTVTRRHSGQANVLFADGGVGLEALRQLLYPLVENWTRFNYDNRQHWDDGDMPNPSGWQPPTPWDELVGFRSLCSLCYPRLAGHLGWDGKAV